MNLERESAFQNKFALLYLYSRHCILCMDVPYNAVASALQDEQDVVVASIDGLRNEIELPVPGTGVFPRILLLDPSRTVAQELTVPLGRAWTVDEIVAFVQKHLPSSSTEL